MQKRNVLSMLIGLLLVLWSSLPPDATAARYRFEQLDPLDPGLYQLGANPGPGQFFEQDRLMPTEAMSGHAEEDLSDEDGGNVLGANPGAVFTAIFDIIGGVGEIVELVFDCISPDTGEMLGQVIEGINELNQKMDSIQINLNAITVAIADLAEQLKLSTDQILSQIVQVQMQSSVSNINSVYGELKNAITTFRNKTEEVKKKELADGNFTKMIQEVCTDSKVSDLKKDIEKLADYMVSDGTYTGAIEAYTRVLINRITIPPPGEPFPANNLEQAYGFLSHYFGEKTAVLHRGLVVVQNYYFARNNGAGYFTYYEQLQANKLGRLSAKYLDCANRLVLARANFRSVNDPDFVNLFRKIVEERQTVYSKGIVTDCLQNADLLAALTSDLKYRGIRTIKDASGEEHTFDALLNRKVLGVFLRHFADPSRAAFKGEIQTASSSWDNMTTPTFYPSFSGAPSHLDWQAGKREGKDTSLWKRETTVNMGLYRYFKQDMPDSGKCRLSLVGVNDPRIQAYTLQVYDMDTGKPATEQTKEEKKIRLQYAYNFSNQDRGYPTSKWRGTKWGYHHEGRHDQYLPYQFSLDNVIGRALVKHTGVYTGLWMHSWWTGSNIGLDWELVDPGHQWQLAKWKNIGDETIRLSVKDTYFCQVKINQMVTKIWLAYELNYGLVKGTVDTGQHTWNLESKDPNAGLYQFVGEYSGTADSGPLYYSVWPRIQVPPDGTSQLSMTLYQYIWSRWAGFGAEKLYTEVDYGSYEGKFELFANAHERPEAWIKVSQPGFSPATGAMQSQTGSYKILDFAGKEPVLSSVSEIDTDLQDLHLGDFDGDGVVDVLLLEPSTRIVSFATTNDPEGAVAGDPASEPSAQQERSLTAAVDRVTILNEGDTIVGVGDFNGDFTDDLLIKDSLDGFRMLMINTGVVSAERVLDEIPGDTVAGIGDLDGDGLDDILFRDSGTHVHTVRLTGETVTLHEVPKYALGGKHVSVFAVADGNGDGIDDLVLSNQKNGRVAFILFNSAGDADVTKEITLKSTPWKRGFRLADVSDYNLDGRADVLWAREKTGGMELYISYMPSPKGSKPGRSGKLQQILEAGAQFIR